MEGRAEGNVHQMRERDVVQDEDETLNATGTAVFPGNVFGHVVATPFWAMRLPLSLSLILVSSSSVRRARGRSHHQAHSSHQKADVIVAASAYRRAPTETMVTHALREARPIWSASARSR